MSAGKTKITWMHIVSFSLATAISYVLGVVSSIIFPVLGAPGVSALYVAAAIYVPLGIWMGMWGALAGYISCFFLGIWPSGYTPIQSFIWAWADFLEALMPVLFFRLLKVNPDFTLKKPKYAKAMALLIVSGSLLLILGIGVQVAFGQYYGEPFTTFYVYSVYIGTLLAVIGIITSMFAGDPKTWVTYAISGVILASLVSGIWGAGTLTLWNLPPPLPAGLFYIVFTGWVIGDMIVLSTIGTALLVTLTPLIKRTGIYVKGWWS
ncbi:MAG: hypothetical protein DRJ51_00600 [Thermoprotei archaeon]|nr:MAG: hypothetical protein DRJ51_00600 [Thermoprotei archaeon]RLF01195.1 MAG: hypothetical protein DRJ59_06645 [Thermoprotei archaeon]